MASSSEIPSPSGATPHYRRLDRGAELFAAIGLGGLLWPLALGGSLAMALQTVRFEILRSAAPKVAALPSAVAPFLVSSATTVLLALGTGMLRRRAGDARPLAALYRLTLARLSFLAGVPLVLAFREPIEVQRGWVALAFAALAGALLTHSAYHVVSDRPREPSDRARFLAGAAVLVLMAVYATLVIRIAFANHMSFNTGRSDLGYYLSVFRKSSQGVPLGCSLCGGGTHTTGHFDPILVPLSVFFAFHPFAETLLVIQALWLASGAVPVYRLAREHVGHPGAAVALAAAYLAYPALHGVNFFDFHSIALCIPPLLWLLLFIEQKRALPAYLALALSLLVREDVSLAAALIGLSCVFSGVRARVRIGWVTLVAAFGYFLIAKIVFMGHADPLNTTANGRGGYALFYQELIPAGRSTGALLATLIGDPLFSLSRILTEGKLDYVAQLLVPLLGLPLLARGRIQLAYGAVVTLLATAHLYSVHAQYSSTLVPVMFGLALSALGRIRRADELPFSLSGERLGKSLAFGMLASSLLCSWKFGGIVPNGTFIAGFRPLVREVSPWASENDAWLREFALSLPRGASVAANSRLVPHLGPISNIYMIEERDRAEYVIANMQNREIARMILADEAKGYLTQFRVREPFRIYRTKYPKAKGAKAPGNDEPEQGGS